MSEERDAQSDPAQRALRGEIEVLDQDSLFRAEGLRRALDLVQEGERPLVTSVRSSSGYSGAAGRGRRSGS